MNFGFLPKTLDDIVGQPEVITELRRHVERFKKGVLPTNALFFVGPSGTGKTSTARVLKNEIPGATILEWDCGKDRASALGAMLEMLTCTYGLGDEDNMWHRILLIDEFDKYTTKDRISLRRRLERASGRVLVIITANLELEDTGLESRTREFRFKHLNEAALRTLIAKVAAADGLELSDSAIRLTVRDSKGSGRWIADNLRFVDPDPKEQRVQASTLPAGVGAKGGRPRAEFDLERAIALARMGWPWRAIGKEVGTKASTVRGRVVKAVPELAKTRTRTLPETVSGAVSGNGPATV